MPLSRRPLVALFLGALAMLGSEGRAADWTGLPVEGNIAGDFTPLNFPGAPMVHWTVALSRQDAALRVAEIELAGKGIALKGEVRADEQGSVTWRVVESRIDLELWSGGLKSALGSKYPELSMIGIVEVSGEGGWRDGKLVGRAQLRLREGRLDDPAYHLMLEGLALDVAFDDVAARHTVGTSTLTWRGGQYDVVAIGAGRIVFAMDGDEVRVSEASVAAFGGVLEVGALTLSSSRADFAVSAKVVGIDIHELLPLLPAVLAEAHGHLDGALELKRDASGIQLGKGQLTLRAGESADLRLAPTPGLLSATLPSTALKYYPGLGKVETGEIPLRADLLEVMFTPEGDEQGRTASVHLTGGPVDPQLKAPIELLVNVHGPLDSLIKLGTNSRLRIGGRP